MTQSLTQSVRILTYQYCLEPLSCAGSLWDIGGRFNAGAELDDGTLKPWPARAAGFEAILYRSTKGSGKCLAVFPDLLASGSFIELSDQPPTAQTHLRLDDNSADELAGWDTLPPQLRSP